MEFRKYILNVILIFNGGEGKLKKLGFRKYTKWLQKQHYTFGTILNTISTDSLMLIFIQ